MPVANLQRAEELRLLWTDRYVKVKSEKQELQRFAGRVGRVVTVNWSGKAIVDFADGAWYDIPATEEYLSLLAVDDPERSKFDPTATSAQALPTRQS